MAPYNYLRYSNYEFWISQGHLTHLWRYLYSFMQNRSRVIKILNQMYLLLSILYNKVLVSYTRKVPLALIWFMRSYFFILVSCVPVREIALALLMRMSMPPKCWAACSTDEATDCSSRTSTMQGRACPPAASTKKKIRNGRIRIICKIWQLQARIAHSLIQ